MPLPPHSTPAEPVLAKGWWAHLISRQWLHMVLASIIAIIMLVVSEVSYRQSVQANENVRDAVAGRGALNELMRLILDAESGQRGYLLTAEAPYLEPYTRATSQINATMNRVRDAYSHTPQELQLLSPLTRAVQRKLGEMELTVRVRAQTDDENTWRALIATHTGLQYMDEVRQAADGLYAFSNRKIDESQKQIEQTVSMSRIAIILSVLFSLLAFYLFLRQSRRVYQLNHNQQQMLQAERDRLQELVRERTHTLRELATHLQNVSEKERAHLARELHDELGALLTAAKLDVARLKSRLTDPPPEALDRMKHLSDTLNGVIALKRRIIEDLRPSSLSNLGLVPALEILTREFAQRSGLEIELSLEDVPLSPENQLTLYRIVQECLTNAGKYAKAKHMTVSVSRYAHHAEVIVTDDGQGFDTTLIVQGAHGLAGMRHRVEAAGGHLNVQSAPGQGTTTQGTLPLLSPKAQQAQEEALRVSN